MSISAEWNGNPFLPERMSCDMRGEWINVCAMRVGVIQSLAPVILDRSIIPDRLFKLVIPVS